MKNKMIRWIGVTAVALLAAGVQAAVLTTVLDLTTGGAAGTALKGSSTNFTLSFMTNSVTIAGSYFATTGYGTNPPTGYPGSSFGVNNSNIVGQTASYIDEDFGEQIVFKVTFDTNLTSSVNLKQISFAGWGSNETAVIQIGATTYNVMVTNSDVTYVNANTNSWDPAGGITLNSGDTVAFTAYASSGIADYGLKNITLDITPSANPPLVDFAFNQADGTVLKNCINSGTDSTVAFAANRVNIFVTNNALKMSTGTAGYCTTTNGMNYSAGTYNVSWKMDALNVAGLATNMIGTQYMGVQIKYGFLTTGENLLNVGYQFTTNGSGGATIAVKAYGAATSTAKSWSATSLTNMAFRAAVNLDTDTYSLFLSENGAAEVQIITNMALAVTGQNIKALGVGGTATALGSAYVTIDDLMVMPESTPPSSYTLTVNGGTGSGSYTNGQQVTIMASNAPTGKTFDVWTGDTQVLASATSSASNTVIMPTNAVTLSASYMDLVYTLTGNAGANGTVTPSSTNVVYGSNADFVITASNYYRIASLTTNGTPVTGMTFDNSSMVTNFTWSNVQVAGTVAVTFTAQLANDPAGTPYWWLAGYGLTNYNTDAVADQDLDGLKTWQEYIAGTDPTNKASCLRAVESPRNVVSWSSVGGKVYSVYWSTNLVSGFTNLATGVQPPYTNAAPSTRANFYQVRVQLP